MCRRHTAFRTLARVGIVATVAASAPAAVTAQLPARDTLAAVVITATRVPIATAAPTASTTVLAGEALRAAGITRVVDALRLVPGAAVVPSGPVGSQTSLFLRGGNSNYVRVLVDGVPVNDAGGSFDFATLTTENIDRIEVVRGPVSVLYGSDAVTGVVQLFTREGRGPFALHGLAGRGERGTVRSDLGVSGGTGAASFTLAAAHEATDGILAFNNRFTNDVLSAALRVAGDAGTDAKLSARWSGSSYHYPTDFTGAVVDHNSEQADHRFVVSLDAGQRVGSAADVHVTIASSEFLPRSNDGPDSPSDTLDFYGFFSRSTRTHRSVDARLNLKTVPRGVLTIGAEVAMDRERSSSLSLSQFGPDAGGFAAARHNTAWFAEAVGDGSAAFSYAAGVRVDRNSAFGSFTTVRAGVAFVTSRTTQVRAAVGSAFKAPSFFENFSTGFVVGNSALRPERSRSAEAGFDVGSSSGELTVRTTAYRQWFQDVIQYSGSVPQGTPNYFNVAAATANGAELEAVYRPDPLFTISGSYTWSDTRTTKAGFDHGPGANYVVGERLIRRPQHTLAVSALRRFVGGGELRGVATRVGARDDRDFSAFPTKAVVLPAYTRVDLSADLPLRATGGSGLSLVARVDNAFGAHYEDVVRYPAPGRIAFVGLRFGR